MLFNSSQFVLFFLVVYALYSAGTRKQQNVILLISSYVFYAAWDWRFLSLIITSTVVDYYCGRRLFASAKDPEATHDRKRYLYLSLGVNLGLLGYFKYFNFFATSLIDLFAQFGIEADIRTLNIILPVGISFYTFQTLSYTIDIYRGKMAPVRSFADFALFVAFFPQLVAGPIERAKNLIPQLTNKRVIDRTDIATGAWLIVFGYFLKVFVADNLAFIVDHTYNQSGVVDGSEALTATYAFAFQIFGDFAGYSSIAIGISRLMGIKLMTNFLYPYFVTNPQDFWRNWHISLSTWLRDFLYVPLGGSRRGTLLTYRNLFLTMVIGGIWHGAAWNFVIWGLYQGTILIGHRLAQPILAIIQPRAGITRLLWHFLLVVVMFHLTCLGWLIFRAQSGQQIIDLLSSVLTGFDGISEVAAYNLKTTLFYVLPLLLIQLFQRSRASGSAITQLPQGVQAILYVLLFFVISIWGEFGAGEFIYFQF